MSKKVIDHPVRNVRDYVRLFNGIFRLTDMELDILAEFIKLQLQMNRAGWQTNAFSTDGRKIVAKNLKPNTKDHAWLGQYIMMLKEKGAITPITGGYTIDPRLIPQGESEIIFRIKK